MSRTQRSRLWPDLARCVGLVSILSAAALAGRISPAVMAPVAVVAGSAGIAVWARRQRRAVKSALKAQAAAKENAEALLEAAGRIARLGHWEQSRDGGNPKWSTVAYEIHELPPGVAVTRDQSMDFIHPDDRVAMFAAVHGAIETGEVFDLEARIVTAQGREIWVHIRGEPIRDEDGKIHSMRGVMQDIDARRRASELLEEKNRALVEATARAEAHARAKSEFLANMSHEIRTPLNAIIGMSDLLGGSSLELREREFVETIHSSGDVLLGLINDILDFSKIESGQLGLEQIPVRLRECVESALDLVAGPAASKRLDLMYWMDSDVPPCVTGDPTRLRQVLVNLLSNAIKFTHQGEVFVKVSVRHDHNGGELLHVAVQDTGIGIPPERMHRLFQAFSQVDSSTTRRYGGTGLGLAISHRLIDKMAGRLWVESRVGEGSTFRFEVPLRPADAPEVPDQGPPLRSLAGLKVLMVDDNATNRWILEMQAKGWGMLATMAAGPGEAMALITAGESFDLAILDVLMPEADGYELAAAIRKLRSEAELPILMLTSVGYREVNLKALGIAAVLTKPVKEGPLLRAVQGALNAATAGGAAKVAPVKAVTLAEQCPLRILVAEDNTVNQRVTALLLQRAGYRCSVVSNGLEVLDAVQRTDFDVILMDVQMPEMDGLEAARCLNRLRPPRKKPWIVALTAHATKADRDECLAAGMGDFLTKPIRSDSLEAALRRGYEQRAGELAVANP